jgi:hypothetical protein
VACMVQGSQWQLQTQWKLYGNSMETQLSYSFAYCRFAHTHTPQKVPDSWHLRTSSKTCCKNLVQSALSFNKATCLFS